MLPDKTPTGVSLPAFAAWARQHYFGSGSFPCRQPSGQATDHPLFHTERFPLSGLHSCLMRSWSFPCRLNDSVDSPVNSPLSLELPSSFTNGFKRLWLVRISQVSQALMSPSPQTSPLLGFSHPFFLVIFIIAS